MPEIYPDELVYSWLARYHVRSGHWKSQQSTREIAVHESVPLSKKFVNKYSNDFIQLVNTKYSINDLIINNTLYGINFKFYQEYKDSETINNILNQKNPLIIQDDFKYFRYCPICAKEDRLKYGETYWHRKWNISNINICPTHKCYLENSDISFSGKSDTKYKCAENIIPQESKSIKYTNERNKIKFAKYVYDVIDSDEIENTDIQINEFLKGNLINTKYYNKKEKSKNTKLLYEDYCKFCDKIGMDTIVKSRFNSLFFNRKPTFTRICSLGMFLKIKPFALVNRQKQDLKRQYYEKKNFLKFDKDVENLLIELLPEMYKGTIEKRPQRISIYSVETYTGISAYTLIKFPEYYNKIKKYEESYPEFWARRVIWAYKRIDKKSNNMCLLRLTEVGKIQKNQLEKALPYLTKYTDEETAERIKQLIKS